MSMRRLCLGVVGAAVLPVVTAAQGSIAIDHKAVECIVAGKFPKMSSCFTPNSDVARARVYFRPEGVQSWYYVEMKSDAPCMAGVLPRPRNDLVGKHVEYYLQVSDRGFNESRTSEYNPMVVGGEQECKDKPVAAYLTKATVKVFPGVPAGFAVGGLGTAPLVVGAVAVAGAGAGIAAASGGNGSTTTTSTTQPVQNTTSTTATTSTTSTTSSTTQPQQQPFRFVFDVAPKPTKGVEPFHVTVNMCPSTPVGGLRFFFNFDGGNFDYIGGQCSQSRTLSSTGVSSRFAPTTTNLKQFKYVLEGCAEPLGRPEERQCGTATATVTEAGLATSAVRVTPMRRGTASRRLAWASDLSLEDGAGQVIANGQSAVFASRGRSTAVASGRRGDNRIEAQLVRASGKPGTWRFELAPTATLQPGSIRVIAGEVVSLTDDTVTFRLNGQPGERIVFTFKTGH
jgi:hypothetical protein